MVCAEKRKSERVCRSKKRREGGKRETDRTKGRET
jgi:hypothetical protein